MALNYNSQSGSGMRRKQTYQMKKSVKVSTAIIFVIAFIYEGLWECTSSELDSVSVPPTQTNVESGIYVEYRLVSTLMNGLPIEFDIASSGDDYIDFANSYLHVKVKIAKAMGIICMLLIRLDLLITSSTACSLKWMCL